VQSTAVVLGFITYGKVAAPSHLIADQESGKIDSIMEGNKNFLLYASCSHRSSF
jgi:hypothetical protein